MFYFYSSANLIQTKITSKYKKLDKQTSERYTNAIAYWIATDMQPYCTVSKIGFKHLMSVLCPGYEVPNRKVFSDNKIPALYYEVKCRIRHELSSVQFLAMTFDCWTSNAQHPYIGITVHFIDNDWNLQTYCLTCTSLDVDHTAYNIRDIIECTLEDWGIHVANICGATTDNGTNVIKAVELMRINHVSCFGHTLNIGVMSSMSLKPVEILISKVSKLRYKFHYSAKLRRLLKESQQTHSLPQTVMPASCVTRWWTTLPALQFIRDQQQALFDVLYTLKSNSLKYLPNCKEQRLVCILCNLYEPLKSLGEHMSSEQVATASSIWPIYLKLQETILKNNGDSRYTCDLSQEHAEHSEPLFPTQSTQCALSTGEITGYLNNGQANETNSSDDESSYYANENDTSVDKMLNHLENHLKSAIKTPFSKRYEIIQTSQFLQKITFLDPRFRSHYIKFSEKDAIISLVKNEMDEIGHQVSVQEHHKNTTIGG